MTGIVRVRWLRLVPGLALVCVAGWVLATRWSVLVANSPAYPVTLLVAGAIGLGLVVTALRSSRPARSGWWRRVLRGLGAVTGLAVAAVLVWLRPYPAAEPALAALDSDGQVTVAQDRSAIRFQPASVTGAGLVLYPGALVDPRAYAVPARAIAAAGHPVVVLKCPYDIAFLCAGRGTTEAGAAGAWAVGGHSLGGVVAALDVASPGSPPDGLLLWASFPSNDLAGRAGLPTASVYGSADGLTTPQDVADTADLLPPGTVLVEIPGAVHSFFGDYGPQAGDGVPTVPRSQAQEEIVAASLALLDRVEPDSPGAS